MYSVLGEWQYNINDKWTTFLGGRVDDHTYTDRMFSPRVAIVHTPNDKDTYKLMWSRSVRANGEEEMKKAADGGTDTTQPEKLDSIELRYERQQNKNLDLAASLFVHYSLQVLSWDGASLQTVPCGTQKEYGLELEATYHTEKTKLLVSHGYTKLYDFTLEPGQHTYLTAKPFGYGNDLANWSNHITKLTLQHKLDDKWTFDASMRIYWGFPGMKDSDEYWPYNSSPAYVGTNQPMIEDGWEKAYRGNYYLNMGLQYQASKDLTIGVMGYNLLGIFNMDLNKRNYITSNGYANGGDYRCYAPAVGVSMTYKF
jgi:iron complex outermembrane receptor protein